jgi:DNA-binding PadR family transcriptional regulator
LPAVLACAALGGQAHQHRRRFQPERVQHGADVLLMPLLVAHGLALARKEYTGRRPRTVYSMTPRGRRSLRDWVAEPGAGPIIEYETLLKVSFAGCGTKADLLGHLSAVSRHAAAHLAIGRTRADEYANRRVPLPENLAINAVLWKFLWQFYSAVQDWAEWATAEAARWPGDLQPTAETRPGPWSCSGPPRTAALTRRPARRAGPRRQ